MNPQSKFIVYMTSGKHSDYGVCYHLAGDMDPRPLLDELAKKMSEGLWSTYADIDPKDRRQDDIEDTIRKAVTPMLMANGFAEFEAIEVYIGD